MTRMIRTVLGDIDPATAGAVDSHDHLFLRTPVLAGQDLVDESDALATAERFAAAGGGTLVQWTPRGLGRGLAALRRISASTGVHLVAATGRHLRRVYPAGAAEPEHSGDELAAAFIDDVDRHGCGLIKVGVGPDRLAEDERDALRAAAVAHHATGVPIAVHLAQGAAAELVLAALDADEVDPRSIVLGHLGRNADLGRILDAARSGAWVCIDTPSPAHPMEPTRLVRILEALIDDGHLRTLLLGADTTSAASRERPREAGPAALLTTVAPLLARAVGEAAMSTITRDNPARAWAFELRDSTPSEMSGLRQQAAGHGAGRRASHAA
jgi:predicted metal-dependent phosphotriesterase family hydrolase